MVVWLVPRLTRCLPPAAPLLSPAQASSSLLPLREVALRDIRDPLRLRDRECPLLRLTFFYNARSCAFWYFITFLSFSLMVFCFPTFFRYIEPAGVKEFETSLP